MGDTLSVGLETNGKGFMGFIVELPGAFIRSETEKEALSKTPTEATSYLKWLKNPARTPIRTNVVQTHHCKLTIEDADCEILLDADRDAMDQTEFARLVDLATFSGQTFLRLYDHGELKDWVDEARIRKTFYGQNKKTIQEIFDHVKRTQYYYLQRTGAPFREDKAESFMGIRDFSLDSLSGLFRKNGNSKVYTVDDEKWTLKKVLRRSIWHDRLHGKAIVRILQKQKSLGLIGSFDDPFGFKL